MLRGRACKIRSTGDVDSREWCCGLQGSSGDGIQGRSENGIQGRSGVGDPGKIWGWWFREDLRMDPGKILGWDPGRTGNADPGKIWGWDWGKTWESTELSVRAWQGPERLTANSSQFVLSTSFICNESSFCYIKINLLDLTTLCTQDIFWHFLPLLF